MKYIPYKTIKWNLTKQLSNLNFSIILLLLIAITSILGTVIEQDENLAYYQMHYPVTSDFIQFINWKIISYLGFDHIYTTWWFLLLLIIFFCSLITCTFSRQLPSLRNARHWKFMPHNNKNASIVKFLSIKSLSNIIFVLNLQQYYVFQKDYRIYAYKGLSGRIAPIFVHLSLIVTLTGSMIGLFSGFTAQQMIPNKEIFHIQNIIKSGICSYLPYNIIGEIDQFSIEYNEDHSVRQFYSYISLFNNQGKHLKSQTIYVNSPLKFHGLTFYQTEWNINALRMKIVNNIVQQKLNETKLGNSRIWFYNFNLKSDNQLSMIITGLQDKVSIYDSSGQFIKSINVGETFDINGYDIVIQELMTSTGLQIKTDPGISIVYSGFLILMISIAISYISYSQIWIYSQAQHLKITGITNRGQLTFEEEMIMIQRIYLETIIV